MASLTPGHIPHAWYSSTCLSKPSSWPLFICKVSVFLSALHRLCFLEDLENLGTLDAVNLVYSILQMRNLPKVPDLVRQSQAASCPPIMPLGGSTPALVGQGARRTGGLNLRILSFGVSASPWAQDPKEAVPSQDLGCARCQPTCPQAGKQILYLFQGVGDSEVPGC